MATMAHLQGKQQEKLPFHCEGTLSWKRLREKVMMATLTSSFTVKVICSKKLYKMTVYREVKNALTQTQQTSQCFLYSKTICNRAVNATPHAFLNESKRHQQPTQP